MIVLVILLKMVPHHQCHANLSTKLTIVPWSKNCVFNILMFQIGFTTKMQQDKDGQGLMTGVITTDVE